MREVVFVELHRPNTGTTLKIPVPAGVNVKSPEEFLDWTLQEFDSQYHVMDLYNKPLNEFMKEMEELQ